VHHRIALLLPLVLVGCSQPTPPPAAPSAPPAAAVVPASPTAAPADDKPSARVTAVEPRTDDAKGVRARILFSNPSSRACRVVGYKMSWAKRNKAVTLQDLTLPPRETRDRWLRVSPDDGDLDALTPEAARVELSLECPPG
jgi:hypothetical protein